MEKSFCCPRCGNDDLQATTETNTQTQGKNYSAGQGCLGYTLAGPFGLLCGLCGAGKTTTTANKTYWVCSKCGKKFRNPDEIREEIKNSPSLSMRSAVIISAVITAILLVFMLSFTQSAFVWIMGAVMFLSGFFGCLMTKKDTDAKREVLQKELKEIEDGMREHIEGKGE